MDWFVKAFIRASLVWFALGIMTGLAMAIQPGWVIYRPAHAHMVVAGFITMMVFGVGYQLLPRLFGFALHSRRLAIAHWWLGNVGLSGMVAGFFATPHIGCGLRVAAESSSQPARLHSSITCGGRSIRPTRGSVSGLSRRCRRGGCLRPSDGARRSDVCLD